LQLSKIISFILCLLELRHLNKNFLFIKPQKGAVQFPKDKPLPLELISKIVKFRVHENLNKKSKK